MRQILALLQIIFASSIAVAADPIKAPDLPEWPQGDFEYKETPEGLLLPESRAQAIIQRLAACGELPGRCQVRLDAMQSICEARIDAALMVHDIEKKAVDPAAPSWIWVALPASLVAGIVVGATIVIVH